MYVLHDGKGKIYGIFSDLDDIRDSLQETHSRIGGVELSYRDDTEAKYTYVNAQSGATFIAERVRFFNFAEHL